MSNEICSNWAKYYFMKIFPGAWTIKSYQYSKNLVDIITAVESRSPCIPHSMQSFYSQWKNRYSAWQVSKISLLFFYLCSPSRRRAAEPSKPNAPLPRLPADLGQFPGRDPRDFQGESLQMMTTCSGTEASKSNTTKMPPVLTEASKIIGCAI